jgi:(p)ppGpp synthase/HD superfamily hydrolase
MGELEKEDYTTAKPVKLFIKGSDTFGVMMRIMQILSEEHRINMSDLHVTSDGQHFTCTIEAMMFDIKKLGKMCMQLRNVSGVNTVNVMNAVEK